MIVWGTRDVLPHDTLTSMNDLFATVACASRLEVAPNYFSKRGTTRLPTSAYSEAWHAPVQSGARPWQVGGLVRRQKARPNPPST